MDRKGNISILGLINKSHTVYTKSSRTLQIRNVMN